MKERATRHNRHASQKGIALLEVSMAMGLAVILALVVMRASMLALAGNQWTIMQTLTDAYLTRETALMVRLPLADMMNPAPEFDPFFFPENPAFKRDEGVPIGRLTGGREVTATLIRFRVNETPEVANADTGLTVWRFHSVLEYRVGGQQYIKSRSTVRMQ